ncbi:hypothetical protein ACFCYB_21275, partial [Streptomyces sp. NPDC056309]|uniref:hypothetical protein n=1 Tax=Streptomyces sp. NPDC056309 TaxID=3345781 RepID=UPI0035DC2AA6
SEAGRTGILRLRREFLHVALREEERDVRVGLPYHLDGGDVALFPAHPPDLLLVDLAPELLEGSIALPESLLALFLGTVADDC